MTKKRWMLCVLVLALLVTLFPVAAAAEETTGETEKASATTPGTETVPETTSEADDMDLVWTLDGGVLTVSGNSEMHEAPWAEYKDEVHTLVLEGGVKTVAAEAFTGFTALTKIDFGSALTEIGTRAFYGCTALSEITLPGTFRRFGEEAFRGCKNLTDVYCYGKMPSFNMNCLWTGGPITVHCMGNTWSENSVRELENNFRGRMEILDKDGADIYFYTEQTLAPTEAPTDAPTEMPTDAPTEPETLAPTETETVPETTVPQAETLDVTMPVYSEATEEPTVPAVQPGGGSGLKPGMLIAGTALALAAIIGLFLLAKHGGRGKYSR